MPIQEVLREFNENNQKVKDSLQKLREEVKRQTSYQIQEYMLNDQFEKANEMMRELEQFIHLDLQTNAEDIALHIASLQLGSATPYVPEKAYVPSFSSSFSRPLTQTNELDDVEKEIIEAIGYTGAAKLEDLTMSATEEHIQRLQTKGYLMTESTRWSDKHVSVFHLTPKGKHYFQTTTGATMTAQLHEHPASITLSDVETCLQDAGFDIVSKQADMLEINMELKSCYVFLPDEKVDRQMNHNNHLKNIGYICRDEQHINETHEQVKKWVSLNKGKSKCLSLHYTTLATLQDKPVNPFRTVHF